MAWAFITSSAASNGTHASSPVTQALGAAVSVGHRIIITVSAWRDGADPVINSVTDGTNTYTEDKSVVFVSDATFHQYVGIWSAPVVGAGTPTVSVSYNTASDAACAVAVSAYSGLSTASGSSAVDASASNHGTTGSGTDDSTSTATGATTAANELVVGGIGDDGNNQTVTAGTGYTLRTTRATSVDADVSLEDKDSGSSGATPAATFTHGSTGVPYGAVAVVYKLAGAVSGGGTGITKIRIRPAQFKPMGDAFQPAKYKDWR